MTKNKSEGKNLLVLILMLYSIIISSILLSTRIIELNAPEQQSYCQDKTYKVYDKEEIKYTVNTPSSGNIMRTKHVIYIKNNDDPEDTNTYCWYVSEKQYNDIYIGEVINHYKQQ